MSKDLEKMCEAIKKEGVIEPQIGIVTPEIRTIDERIGRNVKVINSSKELNTEA